MMMKIEEKNHNTSNDGWYSRKVTNFKQHLINTGILVTFFMEHHFVP